MNKNAMINYVCRIGLRFQADPLFILGNQKSGTTAIASLLASACGKRVTLDIPPLWSQASRIILKREGLNLFVKESSKYFFKPIIKEPWLTFVYPQLKEIFPNSIFVLIVRNPKDNIRSILDRLKVCGPEEIGRFTKDSVDKNWTDVFNSEIYGRKDIEDPITLLAERWCLAASLPHLYGDKFILVRHEDFVQNKVQFIEQLISKVGLPQKSDISKLVDIPYQPRGKNRKMDLNMFFGKKNIEKIETICGKLMAEFGYETNQSIPKDKCAI